MHIAYITPEYPQVTAYSGGIGTSIANLAAGLIENNVQVTVFVIAQPTEKEMMLKGVRVITLSRKRIPFITFYTARKAYARRINYYAKKYTIDILEAPDWTGITAFCSFNVPLVIRVHGSDTYFCHLEKRSQKKKNYWFEKNAWSGADHIIAVSAFAASISKQVFESEKTVTVIPNGIDTKKFVPDHTQVIPQTILYFGTIIRKKGVLALARAFNKVVKALPDARLLLIGKDATDVLTGQSSIALVREELSEQAAAQLTYKALIPYDEVHAAIAEAQIIVLPSYAEAFPMTWLEAMAMEKPLVTSNIGWANEMMVDTITGLMVNPDDTEILATAIVQQLTNKEAAARMGKQARAHVQAHFDATAMVNVNIDFYKKCIRR